MYDAYRHLVGVLFKVQGSTNLDLFTDISDTFRKYAPVVRVLSEGDVIIREWDIPYTIKQLSYLTHSHYRYYGKFPSTLAGKIIDDIQRPSSEHYVLDNFCGSGTSLVEAKLRGIDAYGVDINWISVLASNVKVTHVNIGEVKSTLDHIIRTYELNSSSHISPNEDFVFKWFEPEASAGLNALSDYIFELPKGPVRDFLLIAFIGIVRRVSKAFDGEVRPHVNRAKKAREVLSAFAKKVRDMCNSHVEYMSLSKSSDVAKCLLADNLHLPAEFDDKKCYLVISHPPYLNSFNYTPVFSLELYWGRRFESDYAEKKSLYKAEMRAHPADEKVTEQYFAHLEKCYTETYRIQDHSAYLAIVIGDCTRKGELIPVLERTIEIVKKIGYKLVAINYRTTHYGLGKYAYSHRADYHGEDAEKKDGVLLFRK